MNTFLIFLIKSTLSISLLYLAFQVLMRKEAAFKLNRMILIFTVVISVIIPFLYLPQPIQPVGQLKLEPIFQSIAFSEEPIQANITPELIQPSASIPKTNQPITVSFKSVLLYIYLSGILISILMLIYSIGSVFMLFRKARKIKMEGIRLMIIADDIPAFSFGRSILISQHDFDTNSEAIIIHEQSHIRLGHFYDLMLMELVKIIFWFNPLLYRIARDLREIHEFQADNYTLNKGIDATQYQLLIIQKGVGSKRFALANSFNHCQIKKRIIMMNKSKTSKAKYWKVATFLSIFIILSLSLIACTNGSSKLLNGPGNEISEIKGTWKLLEYNYSGDTVMHKFPVNIERIKFISDNNFCWVNINTSNHQVSDSAGGTYKLSGENYSEFIEYGGAGMLSYANNEQKFTVKVENNKLYLSGVLSSGQKIREVWERVSVK